MSGTLRLTCDLVPRPGAARLCMLVGPDTLDVAAFNPLEEGSLITASIPLQTPGTKGFEGAVYDNPLLLADFGRTEILLDTRRYLITQGGTPAAHAATALAELYPKQALTVLADEAPAAQATVNHATEPELTGFISRTFPTATVRHRLHPLLEYFSLRSRFGNSGRIHLHLRPGVTDILAFNGSRLLAANTFDTPTPADAVYYTLGVAQSLAANPACDRIMLSGNAGANPAEQPSAPSWRQTLLEHLRRQGFTVMPSLFPSQVLRLGAQAVTAPLELITLSLT